MDIRLLICRIHISVAGDNTFVNHFSKVVSIGFHKIWFTMTYCFRCMILFGAAISVLYIALILFMVKIDDLR